MSHARRWSRAHLVGLVTWLVIIVGWEIAAHLAPASQLAGSPVIPSFEFIVTDAFKSLSGSWTFNYWAPVPALGGAETYRGALLAVAYHSFETFTRVLLGLFFGTAFGVGLGVVVSYSTVVRRIVSGPLDFLRMVPLLAAIPLFQFWFGATTYGATVFISLGVAVLLVVATINAIGNVPRHYAESARTLGASRWQTYVRVVVPRSLPELRTALGLAGGLSWSLAVGSEYIGTQNGLGQIMATAVNTSNTGRMIIVAFFIVLFALATFVILDRLFLRLVSWMPRAGADAAALRVGVASSVPQR